MMQGVSTLEMLPPEDSFESLFLNNYPRIFRLLFRMIGNRMEAEDLAQEVFRKFWENPPADSSNQSGWLYRVAIRLGYNALRSSKRRAHYEQQVQLSIVSEETASNVLARKQVRQVLRQISSRSAQMLMLHHSGFSYKEIAEALQISPNSVGTLLTRAEKEFEQKWEAQSNASR